MGSPRLDWIAGRLGQRWSARIARTWWSASSLTCRGIVWHALVSGMFLVDRGWDAGKWSNFCLCVASGHRYGRYM